jgi:hypothetical protein
MVIVQIATKNPTPVEDIKTSNLKPYPTDTQDPYITAYLKADALPLTFVIGDGTTFNYENKIYFNQPLKLNSNYIVFLRFFESKVNSIKKPELNVQLDLAEIFYP